MPLPVRPKTPESQYRSPLYQQTISKFSNIQFSITQFLIPFFSVHPKTLRTVPPVCKTANMQAIFAETIGT